MTNAYYQNWSTAKLKRKYIKTIKSVWYYDEHDLHGLLEDAVTFREMYRAELDRRGTVV